MNGDPFQRAVLAELGHVVYRLRPGPGETAPVVLAQPAGERPAARVDTVADDAMLARLARAAGMSPEQLVLRDPALAALSAGLRADAAAKRALWPRLRALRARAT